MKTIIFAAFIAAGAATVAAHTFRFVNLPYSEGVIYIQVQHRNNNISMQALEVTSDTLSVAIDLNQLVGQKVRVNAFLDLDDNRKLDFDGYGRPSEPCIQTEVEVPDSTSTICLELKQY